MAFFRMVQPGAPAMDCAGQHAYINGSPGPPSNSPPYRENVQSSWITPFPPPHPRCRCTPCCAALTSCVLDSPAGTTNTRQPHHQLHHAAHVLQPSFPPRPAPATTSLRPAAVTRASACPHPNTSRSASPSSSRHPIPRSPHLAMLARSPNFTPYSAQR